MKDAGLDVPDSGAVSHLRVLYDDMMETRGGPGTGANGAGLNPGSEDGNDNPLRSEDKETLYINGMTVPEFMSSLSDEAALVILTVSISFHGLLVEFIQSNIKLFLCKEKKKCDSFHSPMNLSLLCAPGTAIS